LRNRTGQPTAGTAAMGLVAGVASHGRAADGAAAHVAAGVCELLPAGLPALIASQAPLWLVGLTAALLNLRFVVFSAEWSRYFHHLRRPQRIGAVVLRGRPHLCPVQPAPPRPGATGQRRRELGFYLGLAEQLGGVATGLAAGLLLAEQLPGAASLRFVAVLALLTLTLPMLRDRASRVAALAACCVALPAQALPRGLPVLATMLAAMAAAC
jgi:predicted branched-subunit amino acid permease